MLGLLRKLFKRRDPLAKASRHASGADLVQAILDADVYLFAAMTGDGLDPATFTEAELLAEIERTARELSELQEFGAFMYERDGLSYLPFFSSMDHVHAFVGEYSKSRNRVYGFQTLGVKGSTVASCARDVGRAFLNECSPDERLLTDEKKQLLVESLSVDPALRDAPSPRGGG